MSVLLLLAPLLIVLGTFYLAKKHLWLFLGGHFSSSPNPFQKPARKRKGALLIADHKERDKVLKQSFSVDKIPKELDAIVIGSGIGGLSAAAILAKLGKKVLVLEQHDQAGGCCHTFVEKGYEFDVGIHYVGEMAEGSFTRVLFDQLTESGVEWSRLDDVYDTVVLGMNEEEKGEKRTFSIHSGRNELIAFLKKNFPSEEKAIMKYFSILKQIRSSSMGFGLLKLLPLSLLRCLVSSGLFVWLFPVFKYYQRSVSEVLDELTDDKYLKAVLTYSFGDYGTIPKEASFAMQALLTNHFTYGAYYPVGGSSEIAFNLIPTIEATGGRVFVRALITNILMDDNYQRVVGVSVQQGHVHYDIMAPCIISDAGVINTFRKLLPSVAVKGFGINKSILSRVRHGMPLLSVFVGLDGTKEELGLKPSNIWAFQDENFDETMDDYLKTKPEDVGSKCPPLMFVSFPSTKDPTYNQRFPGKSTCAIVTAVSYEWFEQWKDEPALRRGSDYEDYKKSIGNMLWEKVVQMFPQLEGHVEYFDVGSPLTNTFYLGTLKGEVYGADHNTARFSLEAMARMRPDVGIPGLYLTGQDVLSCGFSGALYGGLFCAMSIAKRNLIADLTKLTKQIRKAKKDD